MPRRELDGERLLTLASEFDGLTVDSLACEWLPSAGTSGTALVTSCARELSKGAKQRAACARHSAGPRVSNGVEAAWGFGWIGDMREWCRRGRLGEYRVAPSVQ